MKKSTILCVIIWALILSVIAMLSSCAKEKLSNPFKVYFYTLNKDMPKLYLVQNNLVLGKVPLIKQDPVALDTASLLCVNCYDASTEIDGVDEKGHIVEMFNYTFHNNGSFKEGGGGYLLYDTWQKGNENILIRVNGQF